MTSVLVGMLTIVILAPTVAFSAIIGIHSSALGPIPNQPDTTPTHPYGVATPCLYIDSGQVAPIRASAFEFRVCYDSEALFLRKIFVGSGLHTDWEYFTYRISTVTPTCSSCPIGEFWIRGIADLNDGMVPDVSTYMLNGCLANLEFVATRDLLYLGQCLPLKFCSFGCNDNSIVSVAGDTTFVADSGVVFSDGFDHEQCDQYLSDSAVVDSSLRFKYCAICTRSVETPGDMNLNFIPWEVGDAVLYASYFLYGVEVFSPDEGNRTVQIQASDINWDGLELTIADFVSLINYIHLGLDEGTVGAFGSAPKFAGATSSAEIQISDNGTDLVVSCAAPTSIAGAFLTFDLNGARVRQPTVGASSGLPIQSRVSGDQLRVMIGSRVDETGSPLPAGRQELLRIPITMGGAIELTHADLSDPDGRYIPVSLPADALPRSALLAQNYPNPFNASTVIPYELQNPSHVRIEVYDVLGRLVSTLLDEYRTAGQHVAEWDGADVATGVYFYRMTTEDVTSSRSMLLLK